MYTIQKYTNIIANPYKVKESDQSKLNYFNFNFPYYLK
jgi:hypothetical protein